LNAIGDFIHAGIYAVDGIDNPGVSIKKISYADYMKAVEGIHIKKI
jgi:hypothetical protein